MAAHCIIAAGAKFGLHPAAGRARHGDFDNGVAYGQGDTPQSGQVQPADMKIATQAMRRDGGLAQELSQHVQMFMLVQGQCAFASAAVITDQSIHRNVGQLH